MHQEGRGRTRAGLAAATLAAGEQRFGLNAPDSRWLIVGEVSAEEVNQSGGGGGGGWVLLSGPYTSFLS